MMRTQMRFLILSLFVVTVSAIFGNAVYSQISSSKGVSDSSLFESKEGGFKAGFPSKPVTEFVERDTSFGKNRIGTYTLATPLGFYSVTHTDFPTVMDDKYDINVRFDMMRDVQAKRMSARVMTDSEFYFGDHYGRSIVFESSAETVTMRAFFAGPRLFVLMVGTRGKLSTQSQKLRQANQQRIDKFINSFSITSIPTAKSSAVGLPKDFKVSIVDGKFHSEFFKVKVNMPNQWVALAQEESELLMEMGKDALKTSDPKLAERLTDENARVLAMFSKTSQEEGGGGTLFSILAEKAPYPNFLPSAVADTYLKIYLEPQEKIIKSTSKIQFNGVDFVWIETFDPQTKTFHRLFFANRQGIAFEVSLTYQEQSDLRTMLKALESITFETETLPRQK